MAIRAFSNEEVGFARRRAARNWGAFSILSFIWVSEDIAKPKNVSVISRARSKLLDDLHACLSNTGFNLFRRSANATDTSPPESREKKIRQSSFQAVKESFRPGVKLQVSQTSFMQQDTNGVQVVFDDRKFGNVLKYKKRIDEVTTTCVLRGPSQEILRAGNKKERSVVNAIVSRERDRPLYHPGCSIYSQYFLETTGERNDESPHTASQLQAKKRPHFIQLEEREKLLLNRANPTLPELASVRSLQRCQDVGVWIFLCKFLPFFAGGRR